MIPAKTWTFDVPANGSFRLVTKGRFFKILSCLGLLDVRSDAIALEGVLAGDGLQDYPYDYLTFTDKSGGVNTVKVVTAESEYINAPQVSTAITQNKAPQSASFGNTVKAVTNVSGQLVAANGARQYLFIENKDTTGAIYLNFGAGAATAANGKTISPGGFYELDGVIATSAIQAIGNVANNPNILVIEG